MERFRKDVCFQTCLHANMFESKQTIDYSYTVPMLPEGYPRISFGSNLRQHKLFILLVRQICLNSMHRLPLLYLSYLLFIRLPYWLHYIWLSYTWPCYTWLSYTRLPNCRLPNTWANSFIHITESCVKILSHFPNLSRY